MTKRVIALACAVDPLALSVFFPPQSTFADAWPVVAPPPVTLSVVTTRGQHQRTRSQDTYGGTKSVEFQFSS
ncbi:hypothetical protein MRGA327_05820 [Mycobacterium tuberculosis RGTB327]|nr:hypothetical protein MRGA327_05820 [Mycobacterium tuberculosis RGTB327]